jgi:hypothetical protein
MLYVTHPNDQWRMTASQLRQRQKAAEDSAKKVQRQQGPLNASHPAMTGIAASLIGSAAGISVLAPMTTVGALPPAYYSPAFQKHIDQLGKLTRPILSFLFV